jgi:hypothetical protein
MQTYLAAHDEFVTWLDGLDNTPTAAEVDRRLWSLALCAANRGMAPMHWTFVVDGLIAHVHRKYPAKILLSSYLARGFDLAAQWPAVAEVAARA